MQFAKRQSAVAVGVEDLEQRPPLFVHRQDGPAASRVEADLKVGDDLVEKDFAILVRIEILERRAEQKGPLRFGFFQISIRV